ncbi:MAG: hypothetical protein BroJett011_76270 [Chloroflexota bacterium]|nr:MAG: hypothetical protein BroJett011_76270 [Chloroflexota bacterium]
MAIKTTDGPMTPTNDDAWPVFTADEPLEGFFARYPGYKAHLKNLELAAHRGELALTVVRNQKTHVPVPIVVAVVRHKKKVTFFPLAKLFAMNPYEEVTGPCEEELYA